MSWPVATSFLILGALVGVVLAALVWRRRSAQGAAATLPDLTDRLPVADVLHESQERFRQAFESAAMGMALVRPDGRFMQVNAALCQLVGYTEAELLSFDFQAITHPEDLEADLNQVRQMLAGEIQTYHMEKRYLHRQGRVVWVLLSVSLVRAADGQPRYFISQIQDTTAQKLDAEAARQSAERYRALFGTAERQARDLTLLDQVRRALMQESELSQVFRTVVEAIAQAFGYTQVSLYLVRDQELVLQYQVGYDHTLERIPVSEGIAGRVVRTGQAVLLADVRADPDFIGAMAGITSEVCVPLSDQDRPVGVLNIESTQGVALTEADLRLMSALSDEVSLAISRARLYAEVREAEATFRGFLESAPDAMVIVNAVGEMVVVNAQAEQLFGYTRQEMLGQAIEDLLPIRFHERHRQHRAAYMGAASVRSMGLDRELFGLHKDGHEFPVEVSLSPLATPTGLMIASAIRDISSRRGEELRLQAFASLAQQLGAVTTPKDAARIILAVADQLMGWDAAYLDTYSAERDDLTSVLNFDVVDGQRSEVAPTVMNSQPGVITRRVIAEGGQLMLRSADSGVLSQLPVFGDTTRVSESLMYVPIRHGARVAGVLSIQSYIPDAYTQQSLATLQALADHVGSALDRIRAQADLQQSESRQRYLVEHANDLIYETDAAGLITSFNPIAVRLLGYAAEDLRGRHYLELVHPDQRTRIARIYGRQFLKRIPTTYAEVLVQTKDGAAIWLGQNVQLVLDGDQLVGFQVVARDITRQRQAEQALTEANATLTVWVSELEQRNQEINLLSHMGGRLQACQTLDEAYEVFSQALKHLFPAVSGALYVLNASRDRLEAIVRWGEVAELSPMFAPDECWALRRGQLHGLEAGHLALRCQHLGQAPIAGTLCVPMTAQNESLGLLHLRADRSETGESRGGLAGRLDATQLLAMTVVEQMALALSNLKLRETLRGQAIRDPLTGLFNRRYLEETLERELSRAARGHRPFGVIMLDLDHFKRFNDTFGHAAGDAVLRELGRFFQAQTRGGDIACRYGGEEFTLVLPECSLEVTQRRAEQIREGAKQLAVQYHDQLLGAVTISLGVASFPEHGDSAEALLQLADAALYQAKGEGRDRVITATIPSGTFRLVAGATGPGPAQS